MSLFCCPAGCDKFAVFAYALHLNPRARHPSQVEAATLRIVLMSFQYSPRRNSMVSVAPMMVAMRHSFAQPHYPSGTYRMSSNRTLEDRTGSPMMSGTVSGLKEAGASNKSKTPSLNPNHYHRPPPAASNSGRYSSSAVLPQSRPCASVGSHYAAARRD